MHRDSRQSSTHRPDQATRHGERKEWATDREPRHQTEAREHAREPRKTHLIHELRADEAERQVRELRSVERS